MAPHKHAIISHMVIMMLGLALLCLPGSQNIVSAEAVDCEDLPVEKCAFAVSSVGLRCVLEKNILKDGVSEYKCQTSSILAERPTELIESDTCIKSCGLQRLSVGFSSDALLENDFVRKLCLSSCRTACPNINDLYTKLAAGEGIHLDSMCQALKETTLRLIRAQELAQQQAAKNADTSSMTPSKKAAPYAASDTVATAPAPVTAQTCTVTCTPSATPTLTPTPTPSKSPSNPVPGWEETPIGLPTAPSPSPVSSQEWAPTPASATPAEAPIAEAKPPGWAVVSTVPPPPPPPPSPPPPSPPPPSPPPPPPPTISDLFHGLFPRRRFPPV